MKKELKNVMSNATIVYIEDDNSIREYIDEFLNRYCKNVYSTNNAEDGYELYKKHKPDIMLVDINLPKMSGMELISLIRKSDTYTRIIISTAYTNKEFTIEAVELHITRYLVKPITSKEIIGAFEKALEELNKISAKYFNISLGEGFYYNSKENMLLHNTQEIQLRKKEIELLQFFVSKNKSTITYEMLENEIWIDDIMTQDAIRSQIRNIRKKTHSKIFTNVSGIGYKLYSE